MFENSARAFFFVLFAFMMAGFVLAAEVRYVNGCKVEGDYKNGIKIGVWIYYNTAGEKIRQEAYDDDGFLLSETEWQAGKRHGKSIEYWINGALRSEGSFHEGTGTLTGWYPSGKKKFVEEYVNDKQVGKQVYWHENGQKRLECVKNESGKYEGSYILFQANDDKAFELEYKNGMLSRIIEFNANGQKVRENICEPEYKNGKIVEGKLKGVGLSTGLSLVYDPIHKQHVAEMPFARSGPCVYWEIPGTAKITAIRSAGAGYNCPRNPVEVLFGFTPDDPKRSSKCVRDQHLTVGAGMNPSLDFVENRGLKVGQTLHCIRKEIITGTCSPTVFVFPDINFSDFGKWCF